MTLSGHSKLAGVAGWPIGHSRSPRLHGFWLQKYGIDGAYVPLAIAPDDFETALMGLAAAGFRGINVTLPHKQRALELCDRVDATAARIGAVNTIVMTADGLVGSNSDAFGFLENLRQGAPTWEAKNGSVVVLGAGGAARAVVVALLDAGVADVRLVNRTVERAEALVADMQAVAEIQADAGQRASLQAFPWDNHADALSDAGLLVNTTSLGMQGQAPLELELDALPVGAIVNDIVYTPLETPLLATAKGRGNPCVDGLGMLLHQARPGFEAWFGKLPEVDQELRDFVLEA